MNVVATALAAEYVRLRNKAKGAEKRLAYAYTQADLEEAALRAHKADMALLEQALVANGGHVPPDVPDAPPAEAQP